MADQTKVGVIGYPVSQSLSPLIHNGWIREYGFNALYQTIEIIPERFAQSVRHMIEEGYVGFNVTIPYKQKIMELCDDLSETAEKIGAVNTVKVSMSGKLKGLNTDAFGFVENIVSSDCQKDFRGGTALVLGAGGASRAVIFGLQKMGFEKVIVTNRTREKADALQADFDIAIIDWESKEDVAAEADFLVNTTSLGMTGQPPLSFDVKKLGSDTAVCDIVYKPLMTQLLQDAKANGNDVITGIGMLLHQARPAFEEWFGVMPNVSKELEAEIIKEAT